MLQLKCEGSNLGLALFFGFQLSVWLPKGKIVQGVAASVHFIRTRIIAPL